MQIGLDRIVIRNIFLVGVDLETLRDNVETKDKKFGRLSLAEGNKGYKTIDLKTEKEVHINELFLNVENIETGKYILEFDFGYRYGDFQISIGFNAPRLQYPTNEKNVNDISVIEDIPSQLEKILADRGIFVDIEEAKVADMEININVYNMDFIKTFEILNECWKADNQKVFIVESKYGKESLKLKLSDRVIKVYDKVRQMIESGEIPTSNDITRIEINVKHNARMKELLGEERKLVDLARNFDKIERFLLNTIEKNIKRPFEKYIQETEERLFQELQQGNTPRGVFEKYTDIATKENLILDVDMFKNAVKRHYKEAKKGSPTSVIKGQLKRKKKEGIEIERLEGNIEKVRQVLEELGL